MNLFIVELFENPRVGLTWLLVVIFSICCHEFMHAWAALREGDPTAADAGHLTLNPLRQMGWVSLVMLAICGIAWGAVPVRPGQMRRRYSDALVSFAGPATNLTLFLIFGVLFYFFGHINGPVNLMLRLGSLLNIVLFIFNMLPIPGFDGFAVLSSFFPRLREFRSEWISGAYFIIFFLLLFSFRYLWLVAAFLLQALLAGLDMMFG